MSQDVGGFGLQVIIYASITFPAGLVITQFADDADPLDSPSIQIADKAMGLNGDLITWGKATPKGLTLNVIPGGSDDTNLDLLFSANTVGKGKRPVRDVITGVAMYPDGSVKNFARGRATDYIPSNSVASSGRLKTKPYVFTFENVV